MSENSKVNTPNESTGPVGDEVTSTKPQTAAEHISPVADELANTKYAAAAEHISPVADELANTKYAASKPKYAANMTIHEKRLTEVAIDETMAYLTAMVDRHASNSNTKIRSQLLCTLLETFGKKLFEDHINYFNNKG